MADPFAGPFADFNQQFNLGLVDPFAPKREQRQDPSLMDLAQAAKMLGERQEDVGALERIGNYLGSFGFAVRNLIRGEPISALKNVGDFASSTLLLSPIHGWNPFQMSTKEDRPEITDILYKSGAAAFRKDHPIQSAFIDIAGGLATDPLMYLTGGGTGTVKATAFAGTRGSQSFKLGGYLSKGAKATEYADEVSMLDKAFKSYRTTQRTTKEMAPAMADMASDMSILQKYEKMLADDLTQQAHDVLVKNRWVADGYKGILQKQAGQRMGDRLAKELGLKTWRTEDGLMEFAKKQFIKGGPGIYAQVPFMPSTRMLLTQKPGSLLGAMGQASIPGITYAMLSRKYPERMKVLGKHWNSIVGKMYSRELGTRNELMRIMSQHGVSKETATRVAGTIEQLMVSKDISRTAKHAEFEKWWADTFTAQGRPTLIPEVDQMITSKYVEYMSQRADLWRDVAKGTAKRPKHRDLKELMYGDKIFKVLHGRIMKGVDDLAKGGKIPTDPEQIKIAKEAASRAIKGWRKQSLAELDEMMDLGMMTSGVKIDPDIYLPYQMSSVFRTMLREAEAMGNAGAVKDVVRRYMTGGAEGLSPFLKERRFRDFRDFEMYLKAVAEDYGIKIDASDLTESRFSELVARRGLSHAADVPNYLFRKAVTEAFGGEANVVADHAQMLAAGQTVKGGASALAKDIDDVIRAEIGTGEYLRTPPTEDMNRALGVLSATEQGRAAKRAEILYQRMMGAVEEFNKPLGRPGEFQKKAAFVNRYIKQSLTLGIANIPNPAFFFRNFVSSLGMALADDAIGIQGWKLAWETMTSGPGIMSGGKVGRTQLADLMAAAKGNKEAFARVAGQQFGVRTGEEVVRYLKMFRPSDDTFAAMELIRQIDDPGFFKAMKAAMYGHPVKANKKWGNLGAKVLRDIAENRFPQALNEWIEGGWRTSTYVHLLGAGVDPLEASRRVGAIFTSYNYQSSSERLLRHMFPFIRFAIAQTPRMLERSINVPYTFAPIGILARRAGAEEVKPPWLRDRVVIPLGKDREGLTLSLYSFGLIQDQLEIFGSSPRRFGMRVGAMAHPFVKLPAEYVADRDFYWDTEFGQYRKAPHWLKALGDVGVKTEYTKEGKPIRTVPLGFHQAIGLTPIQRQAGTIDKLLDERKPMWARMFNTFTGMKIASVDEEKALQQVMVEYFTQQAREGNVGEFQTFYEKGTMDPDLAKLLQDYQNRIRLRRQGYEESKAKRKRPTLDTGS